LSSSGRAIDGNAGIRLLGSLVYRVLRRLLELLVLALRSERSKELEILVLRHQLHVVQRQVARPRLQTADRMLLAAFSRSLPRPEPGCSPARRVHKLDRSLD
jgi:hypothetical protein